MSGGSFEAFVARARAAVEEDARRHADDRWWILEPLVVVERRGVETVALQELPDAVRALRRHGPGALAEALDARRAALALHVDLALGGELHAAIVLVVVTPLLRAVQVARVERTDLGTPRLAAWEPSDLDDEEIAVALRRLAG
jgi:hypothetical protein